MCTHQKSYIKYIESNDGLGPVLYCKECDSIVVNYTPAYAHGTFTHDNQNQLEAFLNEGTFEERIEKIKSLDFGLVEIIRHYTQCDCGYDENYTYIFSKFINQFHLLEHYFLKRVAPEINPKDPRDHLKLFPSSILEKIKVNHNYWTSAFRLKYSILPTNDYSNAHYRLQLNQQYLADNV